MFRAPRDNRGQRLQNACVHAHADLTSVVKAVKLQKSMKELPTADELKAAFTDFATFTFELLETIETKPGNLKFAAVHSQIALELFLKYYFVKMDRTEEIQKKKNGKPVSDFNEFATILNLFYSKSGASYGVKKELEEILNIRNAIVHRGQQTGWNEEFATSIVRTLFFIHATSWSTTGEPLFQINFGERPSISRNKVWRAGVASFVEDLKENFDAKVLSCLDCKMKSIVRGDVMGLGDSCCEDDIVCLNCLSSIDTCFQARLIDCFKCHDRAYLIDALNEQENQLHGARCLECDTTTWVRRCHYCEKFYHPSVTKEVKVGDFIFCRAECAEAHMEMIT